MLSIIALISIFCLFALIAIIYQLQKLVSFMAADFYHKLSNLEYTERNDDYGSKNKEEG